MKIGNFEVPDSAAIKKTVKPYTAAQAKAAAKAINAMFDEDEKKDENTRFRDYVNSND